MKKFLHVIRESLNGNTNDPSTIRIQSYLILVPILMAMVVFLAIEIWSCIHAIKLDREYHLSNEIIVVFAMTLSHHLAILFQRNKSQSLLELTGKGDKTVNIENATINQGDAPVITPPTITDTTAETDPNKQINS